MKVIFSPRSEEDLEEIADFIARDSPRRAIRFIAEIRATCEKLADAPFGHELQPQLQAGIRRAVHGRYLIFYSVNPDLIRVERILHGARDLKEDLFDM
ncbi:MAG: type II toxin-antitoxin system RelE/ParE family toxin [Caulobacter sp.]|nr:type II toxin-antitoxin system RelE/ParE family toxin [Caulobacter sp.]